MQKSTSAKGTLYIVSAPSGAGKTSMLKVVFEQLSFLKISTSHTTREQRPGEVDGEDYHFVNIPQFQEMLANDEFLEHAEVFGNFYGTHKHRIEQQLEQGDDVILEIDWQGAQQIRKLMPECVGIFILPPSRPELLSRLTGRGQDSDEVIAGRMAAAKTEMQHFSEYDYLIINDDFEEACRELNSIFVTHRLRIQQQSIRQHTLIHDLLV